MTHGCTLCDWATADPVMLIAQARATWHVYRSHPDAWRALAGDRPPREPDPDTPDGYAALAAVTGTN